jgi:hypothetical protein
MQIKSLQLIHGGHHPPSFDLKLKTQTWLTSTLGTRK